MPITLWGGQMKRRYFVGFVVLAALLVVSGVKAAWYTNVQPGIVAGEDVDERITYTGGFGVYAMGEWKLPPVYDYPELILKDHHPIEEGDGIIIMYKIWDDFYEVGTKGYGVSPGTGFGNTVTAIVPMPARAPPYYGPSPSSEEGENE